MRANTEAELAGEYDLPSEKLKGITNLPPSTQQKGKVVREGFREVVSGKYVK